MNFLGNPILKSRFLEDYGVDLKKTMFMKDEILNFHAERVRAFGRVFVDSFGWLKHRGFSEKSENQLSPPHGHSLVVWGGSEIRLFEP